MVATMNGWLDEPEDQREAIDREDEALGLAPYVVQPPTPEVRDGAQPKAVQQGGT